MKSRAHITFLTAPNDEERKLIESALEQRFNDMVGYLDVKLAKEAEGWRVVEALAKQHDGSHESDWRDQVIKTVRGAGIPLAHP